MGRGRGTGRGKPKATTGVRRGRSGKQHLLHVNVIEPATESEGNDIIHTREEENTSTTSTSNSNISIQARGALMPLINGVL